MFSLEILPEEMAQSETAPHTFSTDGSESIYKSAHLAIQEPAQLGRSSDQSYHLHQVSKTRNT